MAEKAINKSRYKSSITHCIFFLTSQLSRSLEVDAQIYVVAFLALAGILDGVDMERDRETVDRQNHGLRLAVNMNLSGSSVQTRASTREHTRSLSTSVGSAPSPL